MNLTMSEMSQVFLEAWRTTTFTTKYGHVSDDKRQSIRAQTAMLAAASQSNPLLHRDCLRLGFVGG